MSALLRHYAKRIEIKSVAEPIITDELALWITQRAPEESHAAGISNDDLRWRLGRRSLAAELLALHRKQSGDSRATAIQDLHDSILSKRNTHTEPEDQS